MTQIRGSDRRTEDRMLEDLLQQAPRRLSPSPDAQATAREATRDEWLRVTGRRRVQRRLFMLASAASVAMLAVLLTTIGLRPEQAPVQVAEVSKASDTIFIIGEQSEMLEAPVMTAIVTGQTIRTDTGATMGMNWLNGGSFRLDQNTEVRFLAPDRVELIAGRVYFDSADQPAALTIHTAYGEAQHLGTQYMAGVRAKTLVISVREGSVRVETSHGDEIARAGEQLTVFEGRQRAQHLNIATHGADWAWVEAASSPPVLRGKTIYDLLLWVSQETGLTFTYADAATEQIVRNDSVEGDISSAPRVALRQALWTANLHSNIDDVYATRNGVVKISR